jgi:hypothetical protein
MLRSSLKAQLFVATVILGCFLTVAAQADNFPLITVDENCNGTILFVGGGGSPNGPLQCALQQDPGPGGLASVVTYNLAGPPNLTAGDVLMVDPTTGAFLDVVRFNPADANGYPASLLFYSDNVPTADALGDTSSPPLAFYTNQISIIEGGDEINNGALYTPLPGQPGFVNGFNVTYNLISDGAGVPEPGSFALLTTGLVGLAGVVRRKLRR